MGRKPAAKSAKTAKKAAPKKATQEGHGEEGHCAGRGRLHLGRQASVAQLAERLTCNQQVAGSIPAAGFYEHHYDPQVEASCQSTR